MKRETFSDEWVEKTFRGMIEESVYDYPEIEGIPNYLDWYFEHATIKDMRAILSYLLMNERVKVREYTYKYLIKIEEET